MCIRDRTKGVDITLIDRYWSSKNLGSRKFILPFQIKINYNNQDYNCKQYVGYWCHLAFILSLKNQTTTKNTMVTGINNSNLSVNIWSK